MSKLPYILVAIVIGGLVTLQPGLNADVARRLGNPFGAALLSILISVLCAVVFMLGTRQGVTWGAALTMPRYLWLAGTIGFIFVIGTLYVGPVLGGALLFAAIVAGQMIMSTIADLIGLGGYQSHSLDPWRIVGIVLVLAGVFVFQRAA